MPPFTTRDDGHEDKPEGLTKDAQSVCTDCRPLLKHEQGLNLPVEVTDKLIL